MKGLFMCLMVAALVLLGGKTAEAGWVYIADDETAPPAVAEERMEVSSLNIHASSVVQPAEQPAEETQAGVDVPQVAESCGERHGLRHGHGFVWGTPYPYYSPYVYRRPWVSVITPWAQIVVPRARPYVVVPRPYVVPCPPRVYVPRYRPLALPPVVDPAPVDLPVYNPWWGRGPARRAARAAYRRTALYLW